MTKLLKKIFKILFFVLIIIIILQFLNNIITHFDHYQWDFRVYYSAAMAFSANANPYDFRNLTKFAPYPFNVELKFVYPPPTLWFFRIFTFLNYRHSFTLYLFVKLLLLLGLIYLWVKKFLEKEVDWLFYLFILLAFNCTIYADIITGNISIIEQFFLWLGFYFYLKDRYLLFCILLCIASIFKLTPLLFLILLWFKKNRTRGIYFWSTIGCFSLVLTFSYLSNPTLFVHFIKNAMALDERGFINPSSLALIKDILWVAKEKTRLALSQNVDLIVFFIFVLTISIFSWKAVKTLLTKSIPQREIWLLFFMCLIYTMIVPRFKNYSYILLSYQKCS